MKYLIPTGVLIGLAVGVGLGMIADSNPNLGSINVSQEYNATTTEDMTVNEKHYINAYALGNITVASSSAHQVTLYDATSTRAWTITNKAKKIGTMDNSIEERTYSFDIKINDGLILDLPTGYNGSYIISYR